MAPENLLGEFAKISLKIKKEKDRGASSVMIDGLMREAEYVIGESLESLEPLGESSQRKLDEAIKTQI